MKKSTKWLLGFVIASPLLGLIESLSIGIITELLTQKSDAAVLIGVIAISMFVFANFLLFKTIIKKTEVLMKIKSLLSIMVLMSLFVACTRIDAGYEGILIKQYGSDKGVQDVTLVTGRVFYNPWTEDVEQMPLTVQTIDYDPFTLNDKDGTLFTVDPTISLMVLPGNAPKIYTKYRKDVDDIIEYTLYNYVKDAFRIQFNKFSTNDVISRREDLENNVQNYLVDQFKKEGFQMEQLTSGIQYPEVLIKAINSKNQAVQEAMQAENRLRKSEAEARIKIVDAQAEADANRIRQSTLTPMQIQHEFIDKWDGKTPLYGNTPILFKNIQ